MAVHLVDAHAQRQGGGDDGAGGGAGDEVEVVAKPEIGVAAVPGSQMRFDLTQHAQREHTAQPAAVQRQDAFGADRRVEMFVNAAVAGHGCLLMKVPAPSLA